GVEILLKAMPAIIERHPDALFQFVGPYQHIIGEEQYFARLKPEIEKFERSGNWKFLGSMSPEQMSGFYANLDLLVLPSLNSTEAFGLVQIEAMMNGVPCVTSNLPGVRQPVTVHGMGEIFAIGDSKELADKVLAVLDNIEAKRVPKADFSRYSPDLIAQKYEELFEKIKLEL
ncbi:MAG: glycosyltransferase family 4 protein, partial [Anaerolineaceae bacterium]|nr:glycosyltransferase family 4 protein [Anaerolineaceae bacterium]